MKTIDEEQATEKAFESLRSELERAKAREIKLSDLLRNEVEARERDEKEFNIKYNSLGVKFDKELERWQQRDFEAKQRIAELENPERIKEIAIKFGEHIEEKFLASKGLFLSTKEYYEWIETPEAKKLLNSE